MKRLLVVLMMSVVLLAGCVGHQVRDYVEVTDDIKSVTEDIKVYEQNENFETLVEVKAISCQWRLTDEHSSKEDCLNQLKFKCFRINGKGLYGVDYNKPDKVAFANCWNTVHCKGYVIK